MKTLYLVRHAKSSWDDLTIEDYERPLLSKGIQRAKKVAEHLKKRGVRPDLIVSSHAVRAYETAKIFSGKLGFPEKEIIIDDDLYFSGAEAMESVLYSLDDKFKSVMLVGHNPDMTRFANIFLHEGERIDYMPTSGLVSVLFHTQEWQKIMLAKREIPFVIFPKTL